MARVIGMKENDVGLNAELLQIEDALLEVLEELWIELREIPGVRRSAFVGIENGLVGIPRIPLGENAHAQFIERSGRESLECFFLQGFGLVDPGIAGRADFFVRRAVRVRKVVNVSDVDRAMVVWGWLSDIEIAGVAIEFRAGTFCRIMPLALLFRHKANAVNAIAVIKAVGFDGICALGKTGR